MHCILGAFSSVSLLSCTSIIEMDEKEDASNSSSLYIFWTILMILEFLARLWTYFLILSPAFGDLWVSSMKWHWGVAAIVHLKKRNTAMLRPNSEMEFSHWPATTLLIAGSKNRYWKCSSIQIDANRVSAVCTFAKNPMDQSGTNKREKIDNAIWIISIWLAITI